MTTVFTWGMIMISFIISIFMIFYLAKHNRGNQLAQLMMIMFGLLSVHIIALMLITLFRNSNIPLIYFDNITYINTVYMPIILLFLSLKYLNKNVNLRKLWWLFIIPTITLIMVFTNQLHHQFYAYYSVNMNEAQFGAYFPIHSVYTYAILIIAIIIMVRASIKNSGFFSKQTALIVLGCLIPLVTNLLGTLKIIPMTIYVTPIMFVGTAICFTLAIIKYKALNITPIAFRTVIDTMSDAFIVISDDGTYMDSNGTFKKLFKDVLPIGENMNLFDAIQKNKLLDLERLQRNIIRTRTEGDIISEEYHMISKEFEKYFEVDIHPIKATPKATEYVGTLLLFKDITQHKKDIQAIEEKQDIIVKQGQLASIGELAGGVAHDINTPISAIKTGIVMLNSMTSERTDSEKEILYRMDNCATKIINIVNSMRNQIRNLGGDTIVKFKISEVVKDIKVITYHEVAKNKSEIDVDVRDDLEIKGDPTKLGQVLTNLVVNAVQAYGDKGGKINISIDKAPDNMAMIKVTDFAGGLDDNIAPFVFKNILTTKGIGGTGLGLYLAYSVIVGVFNGNITFDTEKGKGTTFYITIPIA